MTAVAAITRTILTIDGDQLLDSHGRAIGRLFNHNLLDEQARARFIQSIEPGNLHVAWSGSLGETLFEPHPRTWMMSGREALRAALDQVIPTLERAGARLLLRPHRHHVLSDIHTCLGLYRERAGQPIGLVLEPAAILAPSMLGSIEDHLTRMFELLGPVCDLVLLGDVVATAEDVEPSAVGAGRVPGALIKSLLFAHVPERTPLAATKTDIPRLATWLG